MAARANEKRFDRFNRSIFLMNKTKVSGILEKTRGQPALHIMACALSVTVNVDFERVRRWLKLLCLRFKLMMSKKMLLTASEVNYIILRKKTHASHEINILETDRIDD